MNPTKLTPTQIGLLAGFVKEALERFPLPTHPTLSDYPIPVDPGEPFTMKPWEVHLKHVITSSRDFGSYDALQDDPLLDELIQYYSR